MLRTNCIEIRYKIGIETRANIGKCNLNIKTGNKNKTKKSCNFYEVNTKVKYLQIGTRIFYICKIFSNL